MVGLSTAPFLFLWDILYQFGRVYLKCTGKFVQCRRRHFMVGVSPTVR